MVTITTAKKALEEIQSSSPLHRHIAHGVLKLFVEQQETAQQEYGMKNFNELPYAQQAQILERFTLPDDRDNLKVDENLVPFERVYGQLVACTVRNNNFHVHGNKQNGR